MTNDIIFYTQIASVIGYIGAVLGLYRLLVSQKDARIDLLNERIKSQAEKIAELDKQTPDALVTALSKRVKESKEEIERMLADDSSNREAIRQKEAELVATKGKLDQLSTLIKDSDFLCPDCGAPLIGRASQQISGYVNGREVDAEIEYMEYGCGLVMEDGGRRHTPCGGHAATRGMGAPATDG